MRKTKFIAMLALLLCLAQVLGPAVSLADSYPSYNGAEWDCLKAVNKSRIGAGALPLTMTAKMQKAADIRVAELKTLFSHTRPNGSDCSTVFAEVGLDSGWWGENIAAGSTTASGVMQQWMSSSGHKANILKGTYRHIGIGYDAAHWVQLFSSSSCSTKGFSLQLPAGALIYDANTKIEDFNIVAVVDCSVHGASYMPLISEMCTGFNSAATSPHTVTAHYDGRTAAFVVTPKTNTVVKMASFPPDYVIIRLPPKIWAKLTLKPVVTPTKTPKPTSFIMPPEPGPEDEYEDEPEYEPEYEPAETFPMVILIPGYTFITPAPTVGID